MAGAGELTDRDPVAEELRGRIHRGELGTGDRLPSERELAVQLGVSRDRLREGLSTLLEEGYLVSRRGATGGHFVTELGGPFETWASSRTLELDDIVDFRLAVECQGARFAAARRTRADLKALASANARLERAASPRDYRLADVAFHGAVVAAARNDRLSSAVERARGELFEPADVLWNDGRNESLADHLRISEAIGDRDADEAARAMADHIDRTRRELWALIQRVASG